jgi:membrane associated rhomboid family serine protease
MGLADRDYTRASPPPRRAGGGGGGGGPAWLAGRVRSTSPRGGLSASFILIVLCTSVFFLDLVLPKSTVQTSQWIVAPRLVEEIARLEQMIAPLERDLAAARASGDAESTAKLDRSRVELSAAIEERIRMHDDAVAAWQSRLEREDYAYRDVVQPGGAVIREALDPTLPPIVDALAAARFERVGPIRAALQFTTAQALWIPQKWGAAQGLEFWRFVGYGLLHVSFVHLLFNMLGLWVFGAVVEQAFGRLRFLALFTLSVVVGALLYFLLNIAGLATLGVTGGEFIVPGLLFNNPYLPLIGASAGVYGVILAAAWLRPDEEILLLYVFPIPLRYFALALIGIAVLTLLQNGQNAGGEAAHLGGAIAGWWIAQRPHLLDDFFPFFHRFDGRRAPRPANRPAKRPATDAEIDRILDKVREKGLGSLSERERESLRTATDEHRSRDDR